MPNALEDRLLAELDEDQRRAVTHGEGPLLVVSGAGSGKTRVLTYRIAYLLATGQARSHEVLAVTFTNKAAREMTSRVETLLGGPLAGGFVGTFHRFALQLLRAHPREAGLPPRFAICDDDDQRRIIEGILKQHGIPSSDLTPRQLRSRISALKNRQVSAAAFAQQTRGGLDERLAELYAAYDAHLAGAGAVDFDDMLLRAAAMLEAEQGLRRGLRGRFRWLLVDEFQDTNVVQARLVRLIGGPRPNLTAVGDEDQSIYRWRGAEVENILRFEESYPGARIVTLGRNYRSAEPILKAAAAVIGHNRRRRDKALSSQAGAGQPVALYLAADDGDEARFVVEEIATRVGTASTAVLFRVNAQSRPFEAELVRRGIPYAVVGGTRFWERAEVRDALAYLRLAAAADDVLAFRRAIRVPARGIGPAAMEVLEAASHQSGVPLPAAARRPPETLPARARLALTEFFTVLDEVAARAEESLPGAVEHLLARSGLAEQYATADEEDRSRRANQDQLVAAAAEAAERGADLAGFLDEVALLTDADARANGAGVQLSTLHAAKGLEFDTVFLVGLEEGLLPLARRDEEGPEALEEERRLAYVGMTRARRRLLLTLARQRRLHGQTTAARPSPFLLEVPRELLEDRSAGVQRDSFRTRLPEPPARWTPPGAPRSAPAAPVAPAPARRGAPGEDGWRPGQKVRHETFGAGVILQVQGGGAQTRLVIYFDRAGRKTLIPSLAKLIKL